MIFYIFDKFINKRMIQSQQKIVNQLEKDEIKFLFDMKQKQICILKEQLRSVKKESSEKVCFFEDIICSLKKDAAQLRFEAIKGKRIEVEKCENQTQKQKKGNEEVYLKLKKKHQSIIKQMKDSNKQQITIIKQRTNEQINILKMQLDSHNKVMKERERRYQGIIKQLHDEKDLSKMNKKESDATLQIYRSSLEQLKQQFRSLIKQKQEQDYEKISEIKSVKLKQKFMVQRINNLKTEEKLKIQQLEKNLLQAVQNNNKIGLQNEGLKKLINMKDQEINNLSKNVKFHQSNSKQSIQVIKQCNHTRFISQLQKNIELKNQEILSLQRKIDQWTKAAGFQKPISQRVKQIFGKSRVLQQKNNNIDVYCKEISRKNVK